MAVAAGASSVPFSNDVLAGGLSVGVENGTDRLRFATALALVATTWSAAVEVALTALVAVAAMSAPCCTTGQSAGCTSAGATQETSTSQPAATHVSKVTDSTPAVGLVSTGSAVNPIGRPAAGDR